MKPEIITQHGIKIIKPFIIHSPNSKPVKLIVERDKPFGDFSFRTLILEENNSNPIAEHTYIINKMKKVFQGCEISTDYYHRNKGYAELMRLVSIILMKENNLQTNKIVSKFEAVPFHLRYNFNIDGIQTPDGGNIWAYVSDILESLNHWIGHCFNKNTAAQIRNNQAQLLSRLYSTNKSCELEHDVCKFLEKFYKNIGSKADRQLVAEDLNYYNLMPNIYMSLKKTEIKNHSGFFNELFKKHGIDYFVD